MHKPNQTSFKKGHKQLNTGRTHFQLGSHLSREQRIKISERNKRLGIKPPGNLGKKHSLETRLKLKNAQSLAFQRIEAELPKLKKLGFDFLIPIGKPIPDIIGIKAGKIYAIEVEYGKPNYSKYNSTTKKYFDKVIWIEKKFGGNWEQELEDLELDPADIKKHQDECAGCAKCEV